jgi:ribosomal protein S20
MNKEEISNVSQLLSSMKDLSKKLDEAVKKKDMKKTSEVKRELLNIQEQIDRML